MKKTIFEKYHVLVIGDVMLDKYVFGNSHRISPEAPVPIINVKSNESRLGGAANVALNLIKLGSKVSLLGVLGNDDINEEISQALINENITNECISVDNRVSTVKTRIIASSQHVLRIDHESTKDIDEETSQLLIQRLHKVLSETKVDYIILQDYNKGVFTSFNIKKIINVIKKYKIRFAVDPKYRHAALFENADIFKPNLKEARELLNNKDLTYAQLASLLKEMLACDTVVLTLSEEGLYCLNNNESHQVPTRSRNIVDVCGAGDTVISMLVLARLAGFEIYEQARLANVAAGIVCQKNGVVPIFFDEISPYFQQIDQKD